jgi:hypothetical protein
VGKVVACPLGRTDGAAEFPAVGRNVGKVVAWALGNNVGVAEVGEALVGARDPTVGAKVLVGLALGRRKGEAEGRSVGRSSPGVAVMGSEGALVAVLTGARDVGNLVGGFEGTLRVGFLTGACVGRVGRSVGERNVGRAVGRSVGLAVGRSVGLAVGRSVGLAEEDDAPGLAVGRSVGLAVVVMLPCVVGLNVAQLSGSTSCGGTKNDLHCPGSVASQ